MASENLTTLKTLVATVGVATVLGSLTPALGEPTVPGFSVTTYAQLPEGSVPQGLSFDMATGILYVGEDIDGKIYRVEPGTPPLVGVPYGCELTDPDAVESDSTGALSWTDTTPQPESAGSVLVGGVGHITAIRPDESCEVLCQQGFTEGGQDMAVDSQGCLVSLDHLSTPALLFRTAGPVVDHCPPDKACSVATWGTIAVDPFDKVVVGDWDGTIDICNIDDCSCTECINLGLEGHSAVAFGPGSVWGTDPYVVHNAEPPSARKLYRIDPESCEATEIGSGFGVVADLAFGPDGALYASMYSDEEVLRIAPLAIPTVSEWGMVAMTLLVVTAGTLVFVRRRAVQA